MKKLIKEDAYDISKLFKNQKDISTVRIIVLTNCECEKLLQCKRRKIEFKTFIDNKRVFIQVSVLNLQI